jgi:hypothetical protein
MNLCVPRSMPFRAGDDGRGLGEMRRKRGDGRAQILGGCCDEDDAGGRGDGKIACHLDVRIQQHA